MMMNSTPVITVWYNGHVAIKRSGDGSVILSVILIGRAGWVPCCLRKRGEGTCPTNAFMQWRRSPSVPLMTHHMLCFSSVIGVMIHDGKFMDNLEESRKWVFLRLRTNKQRQNAHYVKCQTKMPVMSLENTVHSFHYSAALDKEVSSNYHAVFQNGQHMSI